MIKKSTEPVLPAPLYKELRDLGRRWRQSILAFWTPGTLFEGLGYHYIGPIDGHRLDLLIPALRHARETEAPVLVHVLTTKGKGYAHAEREPDAFHGTGPFDLATGDSPKKGGPPTYTEVFARTMIELMKEDPRVVGITAAMPQGTGLDLVRESFPGRVFDLGITEPHCVTFAAGLACEGMRPVVAVYSTFLQRAYDQILHDVCLQNLPVIFCLDRAGIVGEDGPTHHGLFDLSYLRAMPNLSLLAPADEAELRAMLHAALARENGPIAIRYPRGRGTGAAMAKRPGEAPWGKAEVKREGRDAVLVSIGHLGGAALQAAAILAGRGIDAAVINARFVKPLDRELILAFAQKTGAVVTLEENVKAGGFGDAVFEAMNEAGLHRSPILRLGVPDVFVSHGSQAELRKELGLDPEGIAESVAAFLHKNEIHPGRS
jgi:1-deoxy-D-xylulose-5-phosphate synthase